MGSSASQSEFEVNNIATSLNNKADKDFSNVEEPVERFKEMVLSWISGGINVMDAITPNYSAGVSIASGYTAPSNGWVYGYIGGIESSTVRHLYVNGVDVGASCNYDGGHVFTATYAFVSPGDVITAEGVVNMYFFPLKGVSNA